MKNLFLCFEGIRTTIRGSAQICIKTGRLVDKRKQRESQMETSEMIQSLPATIPAANNSEASTFEIWQDPALPGQILHNLEEFAHGLKASVEQQEQIKSEMNYTGQQMSQVFGAMSQLLDLMYDRVVSPQALSSQPQSISPESLAPLATSMTEAFGELNRRVHSSEERQVTVLEATLKQLEMEREIQRTSQVTQIETLKVQTRVELNRLLQVLLVGTAVAAAGAGVAFYIMA